MSTPDPTNPTITPHGAMLRDDNDQPVQGFGMRLSNSKTLTGNNTTVPVPIFTVTGTVEVLALYGVVTTALGANNTAAYWRLNDGSNQSNITLNTGTSLSAAPVGSSIVKKALAATALSLLSSATEIVSEPAAAEGNYFSPFIAQQINPVAATNIEFVYTTTDAPTSGTIQFFVNYIPISQGSSISTV